MSEKIFFSEVMSEILFRHVFENVFVFLKVGKDNGETKMAMIVAMAKSLTENFRKIVETEIMTVVETEITTAMTEITSLAIGTMTEIMIVETGITEVDFLVTEVVFLATNLATILTAIQEENFKTITLTISFVTLFLSKIASSCLSYSSSFFSCVCKIIHILEIPTKQAKQPFWSDLEG